MASDAPRRSEVRPVPLARVAACMDFAILRNPLGYWSYLARFADNPSFKLADPFEWFDIPEALQDATAMMHQLARLAELTEGGEARVRATISERLAALEARETERLAAVAGVEDAA